MKRVEEGFRDSSLRLMALITVNSTVHLRTGIRRELYTRGEREAYREVSHLQRGEREAYREVSHLREKGGI